MRHHFRTGISELNHRCRDVRILRHYLQRWIAAAADDYGRMRLLDVRRLVWRLVERVVLPPELRPRLRPQQLDHLNGLVEALHPFPPPPELDTEAPVLAAPPRTDPQLHA